MTVVEFDLGPYREFRPPPPNLKVTFDVQANGLFAKKWSQLPSLSDVFGSADHFNDEDIDGDLREVARKLVVDAAKFGTRSSDDFLNDMAATLKVRGTLSDAQCRGVLNVVGKNLRWRHRYYLSRFHRFDRGRGDETCLACGAPLTTALALQRGLGTTCYRRALGFWGW